MKHKIMKFSLLFSFIFGNFIFKTACAENKTFCYDYKNWCQSIDTASKCDVLSQCSKYVWNTPKKVIVSLYYESLCPGCRDFTSINGQLWKAYKSVSNISSIFLVPYGNAKETWNIETNQYDFTCQHGPDECWGNLFQSCLIFVYPDVDQHYPFIACVESNDDDPIRTAVLKCSKSLNMNIDQVEIYMNSSLGNKIQHENAVLTEQLNPPHKYVPWITINNQHTEEIEQDALNDLVKLICVTYSGTDKPSICLNY